jgi:ABC-type uncharacterized transport system permease subunit
MADTISREELMKNKNIFLVIGQIALAISILLNHFAKDSTLISFSIGLLTGLSIVFNISYALNMRQLKSNHE